MYQNIILPDNDLILPDPATTISYIMKYENHT